MTGTARILRLPPHAPGMRIGLYGGSFDPPHAGHLHVARTALRRLGLDRVWWIVVPANPLKGRQPFGSEDARLRATRAMAGRDPRMVVVADGSGLAELYTVDTIRTLRLRCPAVRFVWIMGADSLAGFHHWRRWREIARLVPLAVVDRPGWTLAGPRARAASALAGARLPERAARRLAGSRPPAWVFLHDRRSSLSSTALRRAGSGRLHPASTSGP